MQDTTDTLVLSTKVHPTDISFIKACFLILSLRGVIVYMYTGI